tara:strand:- start:4110 stop:4316 length:207 start_codon:yes stop_codon:yes gene_type:complete
MTSNLGVKMKQNKEQWNHRIKCELADGMRALQENRKKMAGQDPTLRDLTEEAIFFFLNFNGIKIRDQV